MMARLGVHQTFSQPHRLRANGRTERGGQQIMSTLRKLHVEEGMNWVEVLPRALQLHHDMANDTGLSPYQVVFGRSRTLPGIPYSPERECEDAMQYFNRMEELDKNISQTIQGLHEQQAHRFNSAKKEKSPYKIGERVWVLKLPRLSSTAKLEPRWKGPMQGLQRHGANSYTVIDLRGGTLGVHVDQLKPYCDNDGRKNSFHNLKGCKTHQK